MNKSDRVTIYAAAVLTFFAIVTGACYASMMANFPGIGL